MNRDEIQDLLNSLKITPLDYEEAVAEFNAIVENATWQVIDIVMVDFEGGFKDKMKYLADFWIDNNTETLSQSTFVKLINYFKWLPKYLPQKQHRSFNGWLWKHGYQFCQSQFHQGKPKLVTLSNKNCSDCNNTILLNEALEGNVDSLAKIMINSEEVSESMKKAFYQLWKERKITLGKMGNKKFILFEYVYSRLKDIDFKDYLWQKLYHEVDEISSKHQEAIDFLSGKKDLFEISVSSCSSIPTVDINGFPKDVFSKLVTDINNLNVIELMELYKQQQPFYKPIFFESYIKQRFGNIFMDSKFIDDLRLKNLQEFAASMGWSADKKPYTKILGLDIGTEGKNLRGCSEEERRKRIKNSHLANIGWHWNGGQGSYVDSKKTYSEKLDALREQLQNAEILVGYNLFDFDLLVLKDKGLDVEKEFPDLKIYDLMAAIYNNHVYVRESLSNLLIQNGLPEKDNGSNRGLAAQHDAQATIGCFNLLVGKEGLKYGKVYLRTDLLFGISKLRDVDNTKNMDPDLLALWEWKALA